MNKNCLDVVLFKEEEKENDKYRLELEKVEKIKNVKFIKVLDFEYDEYINELKDKIVRLKEYDYLIITSSRVINAINNLIKKEMDSNTNTFSVDNNENENNNNINKIDDDYIWRRFKELKGIYIVGKKTKKQFLKLINQKDDDYLIKTKNNATELSKLIINDIQLSCKSDDDDNEGFKYLYLCGNRSLDIIENELNDYKINNIGPDISLSKTVIYRTKLMNESYDVFKDYIVNKMNDFNDDQKIWLIFFSPSGVDVILKKAINDDIIDMINNNCLIGTIGKTTKSCIDENYDQYFNVEVVASTPSPQGVKSSIYNYNQS